MPMASCCWSRPRGRGIYVFCKATPGQLLPLIVGCLALVGSGEHVGEYMQTPSPSMLREALHAAHAERLALRATPPSCTAGAVDATVPLAVDIATGMARACDAAWVRACTPRPRNHVVCCCMP